jgi:hypothetical protein
MKSKAAGHVSVFLTCNFDYLERFNKGCLTGQKGGHGPRRDQYLSLTSYTLSSYGS